MKPWMILLCIGLALWMISMLRVGIIVRYGALGLRIQVRAGQIKWTLFPMKRRKVKKKRTKAPVKPVSKPAPEKGGSLEQLQHYLPLIAEAAGRFQKKLRIDVCDLELVWAADDPADAALGFGYANAVIGMLWPLIEHNFTVCRRNIRTSVDFEATRLTVVVHAAVSLRIGQGAAFAAVIGFKLLNIMRTNKKEQKLKEAV